MGTVLFLVGFTCPQINIQSVIAHQRFAVLAMGRGLFGEMMKMNRELIFRGFHPCDGPDTIVVDGEKVKGRWVQGYFFQIWERTYILWGTTNDVPNMIEVLPSTVGQYINVDCFGTKVFEHDVIAVEDEQGEIYRFCVAFGECGGTKNVKHKVGYMGFHFEARDEETKVCMKYGARDDILYWLNAYNCEVIGTVFDADESTD